ncbi:DMT family transporter [Ruegeria pomeroyi]|uniref:DMT family transporter n=1 Tax=Ruegeria pomeroyi TaxID=89184 RepID=A0A9Q3WNK0_9RHOB|nr:DMT family transporter [Ruegeria pomeroyi]MCE8539406.1 DMT family transporter [Ruegeria pomeroyi]
MNNVNGILLVVAAMAAFTLEDMFIKQLSVTVPTGQILLVLGVFCSASFLIMAVATRKRVFSRAAWSPLLLIRAGTEAISALTFITALSLVDLSTVAAVFQAMPLAVTMGAALFLGEQVGWRRWSAIAVGFAGVMMIIRPGMAGFQPEQLFVVASVISVAARDLITRRIDVNVASAVVSFQAYLALILAGAALLILSGTAPVPVAPGHWGPYAGAVLFGVLGYYGIVTAMRVGEASAVTPFRYTRLLFSILAGVLVFGERPDLATLAGAGLIIASGLYTFLRERRLARELAFASG